MGNIAVIPARGGSRRIPRKNIRLFHGKPIIAYSIDIAKQTGLFDHILVSTDDPEIADIAINYGANTINRPPDLALDSIGTNQVMAKALKSLDCTFACCVYPTAPMMMPRDLNDGFNLLIEGGYEFVRPVGRQIINGEEMWVDPGQWYWGSKDAFVNDVPMPILAAHVGIIQIPETRACDINTAEDWAIAEKMYANLQEQNRA